MDFTRIKYHTAQRICTITLSRPEKHNAIDDMMPFKKGGKIKKFADGGLTGMMSPVEMERRKRMQADMATLSPDMLRQLQQQTP